MNSKTILDLRYRRDESSHILYLGTLRWMTARLPNNTEYGQTISPKIQGKGKTLNLKLKALVKCFKLFLACLISARKMGTHPGTDLVGASDSAVRRTTAERPPWLPLAPLNCLGWWGRCSIPENSLKSLPGICITSPE